MPILNIDNKIITIDIRSELEEYEWKNAKWSEQKLIACSPFRDDSSPSFFVALDGEYAGVFGDSGYEDEFYKDGPFVKLLAFLRNETIEETCDYLLSKYDVEYAEDKIPLLTPKLSNEQTLKTLDESLYKKKLDDTYLKSRGIHSKIVELNGVFDADNAIGIPWRNHRGEVAAIKYRHKKQKTFWYEDGGTPLAKLVFGLDIVIQKGIERIAICEAEIDAMTWQSTGVMAVAIGGARMNEYQAELIINSGVKKVILAGDNDESGRKFNRRVYSLLKNFVEFEIFDYAQLDNVKDVNETKISTLLELKFYKISSNILKVNY